MKRFFQLLMLNISSIKELLKKPSNPVKYNWNSTRKTEKKNFRKFQPIFRLKTVLTLN